MVFHARIRGSLIFVAELHTSGWGFLNSAVLNFNQMNLNQLCDFLLNYFLGNKETTSGNGVSLQDASSLCCAGKARCCWLHSVGILMADVSAAEPLRTLQAMLKTYHPKYLTV